MSRVLFFSTLDGGVSLTPSHEAKSSVRANAGSNHIFLRQAVMDAKITLFEDKVNRKHQKNARYKVVEPESLCLEKEHGEKHKDHKCYNFLYDFELH